MWPEVWSTVGKAAQNREKQEWKNEKTKLDNARRTGEQKESATVQSFQVLAWMIIISRRKNLNQLENYLKCAHMLSQNVCIWPELVHQTFCGHSVKLPDLSQNGLRLVTDVWLD